MELKRIQLDSLLLVTIYIEGRNSADSDVWHNLGLAETCDVGQGAAIFADGQTTIQISGLTIRTFEGPAIRALNDTNVTIDMYTILGSNGLRNMNILSSMQINVVCEEGISTTTIDIDFDNIISLLQSRNGWIFYLQENSCNIKTTYKGESAQSRYHPYIYSTSITIQNTNQRADITVEGKF
ncbi:MAG: hypothetical protein EZS28_049709 [Streblomastix strix]|uniref:Uncharacterized protein n=1 Tax=Streblomastix strix TaxID=222440 RepID=A0A5J4T8R2_9EUKA|nr:MAG: hypothetical protein EZS28_049709 [Streblomastix strix]